MVVVFFFQAEDGIRDADVTGVQTCALPISASGGAPVVGDSFEATFGRGRGSGGPAWATGSCGTLAPGPAGKAPAPRPIGVKSSNSPSGTIAIGRGGRPNGGRSRGMA